MTSPPEPVVQSQPRTKLKTLARLIGITNLFHINSETPIICYKYNKPIRSTIFNFNRIVTDIDIDSNTPDSLDCQNSNYLYPSAVHVITGNLNVIPDARVRNIISKGPK